MATPRESGLDNEEVRKLRHGTPALASQDLLWLLGSMCALHRIPFDAALVAQQFPPPHRVASFHEAARGLGFKTGAGKLDGIDWRTLPLPAIAFLRIEPQATAATPILILKSDDATLLYFCSGSDAPQTLAFTDAPARLDPNLILIARDSAAGAGKDEEIPGFMSRRDGIPRWDEAEKKPFGFSWFVPELLKHKRIWRDILLASLVIQLVGLATPLFTQVIIDKVVVHQTQNTLVVLGVALVMFMIFTSAMTWLRQYLVLHTGNRIDAVLGSQVFRHLLHLPAPYFEHRPTGTLVARLHGVETIREFVSGAAVTLILDFPFLLIFLAVMFWYSWQLSLIVLGLMSVIAVMSLLMVPVFRERLNRQFMLGARNQAFLTEYICGMDTVKSLQMEPDVDRKYGDLLAGYLAAGFSTKQVGNTYNVIANGVEQVMTLSILVVGALLVMRNEGFTIGMLVAFQMFAGRMSQPMLRLVGLWQEFQQANIAVKRLGDILDIPQEPHTLTPAREAGGSGGEFQGDALDLTAQGPSHVRRR